MVLEKYWFGATRVLLDELRGLHADQALRQATLDERYEPALRSMVLTLRSWLLKASHTERRVLAVRVPATWWDHLLHDMRGSAGWLARAASWLPEPRYRLETEEFDAVVRVCPHNNSYLQDDRAHVEWLSWADYNYHR